MGSKDIAATSQHWDAGLYDGKHSFVWQLGSSLIALLDPNPGERILDLGCGTGHLTARIAEAGATTLGLDHSAEMLDKARSVFPALAFIHGDARSFTVAEPFDAVFSNATLHWIKEPEPVIRCVRNALKPGGRLIAEFGGRGNIPAILAALRIAADRVGMPLEEPLWYFPSAAEYASLLEAAGMEVVFAALFDRPTPLDGASGLRDWVRMFARGVFDAVPAERQEEFLLSVEDAARPVLLREGVWVADYRRLRIAAVRMP